MRDSKEKPGRGKWHWKSPVQMGQPVHITRSGKSREAVTAECGAGLESLLSAAFALANTEFRPHLNLAPARHGPPDFGTDAGHRSWGTCSRFQQWAGKPPNSYAEQVQAQVANKMD